MTTVDRNGDQILIQWADGTREWISEDDYRAYALGTKQIPVPAPGPIQDRPVPGGGDDDVNDPMTDDGPPRLAPKPTAKRTVKRNA